MVAPELAAPPIPTLASEKKPRSPTHGGYTWGTGRRKTAIARVRVRAGSGQFKVNKREADIHFVREVDRKAIRAPLEAANLLSKLDVFVNVVGGGTTGQAGAIVLGIARAISNFDSQYMQSLRDGGFLTRDSRRVERKKYGQRGARRRFQFSKR
ncbi:MAG: 30S ribosomal protein S9 [bacterium]|nr:30S ribosomal protein S9 [bacterium]